MLRQYWKHCMYMFLWHWLYSMCMLPNTASVCVVCVECVCTDSVGGVCVCVCVCCSNTAYTMCTCCSGTSCTCVHLLLLHCLHCLCTLLQSSLRLTWYIGKCQKQLVKWSKGWNLHLWYSTLNLSQVKGQGISVEKHDEHDTESFSVFGRNPFWQPMGWWELQQQLRIEKIFGSCRLLVRKVGKKKPKEHLEHRILVPSTEIFCMGQKNTNKRNHHVLYFSVLSFKQML